MSARPGRPTGPSAWSALLAALAELSDGQRAAPVDGTFVAVARPGGGREDQKRLYNHHKHRHTRNLQAVTAVLDAAAIGFALQRGLPARADSGDLHEFGMWW